MRVRGAYGLAPDLVRERLRVERVRGVDLLDKPEADLSVAAGVGVLCFRHGAQRGCEGSAVLFVTIQKSGGSVCGRTVAACSVRNKAHHTFTALQRRSA